MYRSNDLWDLMAQFYKVAEFVYTQERGYAEVFAIQTIVSRRRAAAAALIIIIALTLASGCGSPTKKKVIRSKPRTEGPSFSAKDRVLIVAPHPDDETLATGSVIQTALKKKLPIKIVLMTVGDGYKRSCQVFLKRPVPGPSDFRDLGVARHEENLKATGTLGVKPEDVIYLTYNDGSTNSLFDDNWDYDKLHLGSTGELQSSYPFAYQKGAPYCGANVVKNMSDIFKSFKPTVIFYPDPQDDHHDHWATSAFTEYTMSLTRYSGRSYTYLVHKGFIWPFPWAYAPTQPLVPPVELMNTDAQWLYFPDSSRQEKVKDEALHHYASQEIIGEPFLRAFIRKNELFARYPDLYRPKVAKKPDFFAGKVLPDILFVDPNRDTLTREMKGFADIREVSFDYTDKKIWLAISTRLGFEQSLVYGFHLRIFNPDSVKRIDVNVMGAKAMPEIRASNGILPSTPPKVESKGNRMVLEMPSDSIAKASLIMLNVDVYSSRNKHFRRIDRSAWRRVFLRAKK